MRLLLDTSGYSAFKRGQVDAVDLLRRAIFIALNPVILAELLVGFAGGRHETRNRRELSDFMTSPRVQLVSLGAETAERFALVHQVLRSAGRPIPTHDIWIAATALEHGLRVLTADAHFKAVPMLPVEHLEIH